MNATIQANLQVARRELLDAEFSFLYLGGSQSAIVGARKKINALEWGIVDGESLWKEVRTGNTVRKVRSFAMPACFGLILAVSRA